MFPIVLYWMWFNNERDTAATKKKNSTYRFGPDAIQELFGRFWRLWRTREGSSCKRNQGNHNETITQSQYVANITTMLGEEKKWILTVGRFLGKFFREVQNALAFCEDKTTQRKQRKGKQFLLFDGNTILRHAMSKNVCCCWRCTRRNYILNSTQKKFFLFDLDLPMLSSEFLPDNDMGNQGEKKKIEIQSGTRETFLAWFTFAEGKHPKRL